MPRKRKRRSRVDETMQRNIVITSVAPSLRFTVEEPKSPDPDIEGRQWLELRGQATEPLRDVQEVVFHLWPEKDFRVGPARPVGVAHITSVRPRIEVIGSCRYSDFEYLWSMALTGYLCHAYISFSKPHYGSAKVFSMSFSNEPEE